MFTEKKAGAPRVALVGCSTSKLKKSAPARELYTSALFRAVYAYAEKTCDAIPHRVGLLWRRGAEGGHPPA